MQIATKMYHMQIATQTYVSHADCYTYKDVMQICYTGLCYMRKINRYKGYMFTINNMLCLFSLAPVLLLISGKHCQYRKRNVRSV